MKVIFFLILMVIVSINLLATDYMLPGPQKIAANFQVKNNVSQPTRPDTCIYSFSVAPINLLFSYYDYMIGGYNDIPLCVQPDPAYGGYFLT